jgi:hypothetical protein
MTAIDLFVLPTISFRPLCGLSIAALGRRQTRQLGVMAQRICDTAVVISCTIPIDEVFLFGASDDVGERRSSRTPLDRIDRK